MQQCAFGRPELVYKAVWYHLPMVGSPARLLVFFVVALGLCTACGRGDERTEEDTLRVAMSTFSEETFLPWNGSTGRKFYLDTIYEYLAYLDPETLEARPGLAERWEMSADGLRFTLYLRRGIPFHDGWGELTAADVKYTLDRIRDPQSIAGPSSPLRKLIADVAAPDSHTVVIDLTSPDIDFVRAYLSNGLVVPIVCRDYVEKFGDDHANRHPIGTGAYRLAEHRQGVAITVAVPPDAPEHWRVEPHFNTIRFFAVGEEFTRAAMLKTGEVDLAPINYDSIRAIRDGGRRVLFVENNWAPVLRLGGLTPRFADADVPWLDLRVRRALNYAVDKQAIVDAIFHGHARVALSSEVG